MTDPKAIAARLREDCDCADNVDAEQQCDGSWVGSFSTCLHCEAASRIESLERTLAEATRPVTDVEVASALVVPLRSLIRRLSVRATTAEKALAEARGKALEEAAVLCDHVTQRCFDQRDRQKAGAFNCAVELAAAIRSLQTEQKP